MQTQSVRTGHRENALYLLGAAIVWAGIFIAVAVVLQGTPYFGQLLPILGGGAVYFVVLVPMLFVAASRTPSRTTASQPRQDP
ncbi:MAG TPA: hypothetical protein VHI51_09810 [Ktedonobacterales bacterium]|nr:hypothetical protein [Ktedonobacterales bacterium]